MQALPLKDYQVKVLDAIDAYLREIQVSYAEKQEYYQFQLSKGKNATHPKKSDYLNIAWEELKKNIALPRYKDKNDKEYSPPYQKRVDGLGYHIPNISLKVPTGGGKTLLAVSALGRIKADYQGEHTGLVLWIVPTDTIYKQTLATFCNREHPYRMQLDSASGGRTKILERQDNFTPSDVQHYLCVMILTLQSFNVGKKSKDARKIFSDTGRYSSFFPDSDDYIANKELISKIKNLEGCDLLEKDTSKHDAFFPDSDDYNENKKLLENTPNLGDTLTIPSVYEGICIRHSLGNVFRILKPVIVIDEEHKAKSEKAIHNINGFNPSFILELSATPREHSNKLVDISGQDLKNEEMIKMPINIKSFGNTDWQDTLNHAVGQLHELEHLAEQNSHKTGQYIRPIMVIIAEAKKKDESYDHVEDIKKHLLHHCQVAETAVRIKLSGINEIDKEDLSSPFCPVQYIITKDALREGWDCPFAYILTILTNKNSDNALTQYVGRVLRQPNAKRTPIAELNECYIYCSVDNVASSVESIKKGLESEGLGDLAGHITSDDMVGKKLTKVTQKRLDKFKNDKIFIPKLNSRIHGTIKPFDYYRDILAHIDWEDYHFDALSLNLQKQDSTKREAQINYRPENGQLDLIISSEKTVIEFEKTINISLMTSQLLDSIPNAFVAYRILDEVIISLKKSYKDGIIASESAFIVKEIRNDIGKWLLDKSETLFTDKIKKRDITLNLFAEPLESFWELPHENILMLPEDENPIPEFDNNILQPQYESLYNGLEYRAAHYINSHEAIKWWHRLAVNETKYFLQGWKKDRIFPDFLIMAQDNRLIFIETKGNHLKNDNSDYKAKLFNILTHQNNLSIGTFKLASDNPSMAFHLLYDEDFDNKIRKIL